MNLQLNGGGRRMSPVMAIALVTGVMVAGVAVLIGSPLISAVATPIFAAYKYYYKAKAKYYYKKTLDRNNFRTPFGRLIGQNYTFKSGTVEPHPVIRFADRRDEHIHKRNEEYRHFQPNSNFITSISEDDRTAFSTDEDKKWLDNELRYRRTVVKVNFYSHVLKYLIPGFIPILGPIKAIFNFNSHRCTMNEHREQYWSSLVAIDYHKRLMHRNANPEVY